MERCSILEAEIRPDDYQGDLAEGFRSDGDWLLARYDQFEEAFCPACDGPERIPFFEKNGFFYHVCGRCQTVYISPRPSAELLSEFYSRSKVCRLYVDKIFPASHKVRREEFFRPRVARVIESCKEAGFQRPVILEVGAGFGIFCEEASKSNFFNNVIAVEPNRRLAESCRERGIQTIKKIIENVLPGEISQVDVVCAFEVIEHLVDPRDFLNRCRGLLRENGIAFFSCPNGKGFDLDMIGFFSDTYNFQHLNYFNPKSLSRLLEKCGFRVLSLRTPGKLDVDLVRKATLCGKTDLSCNAFINKILLEGNHGLRESFQQFLSNNKLSGHLEVVVQKIG